MHSQGFTIVELLIVIVVIAILAAITVVAYQGIQNRASDTAVLSDLKNAAQKVNLFQTDSGKFPSGVDNGSVNDDLYKLGLKPSKNAYSNENNYYYCKSLITEAFVLAAESKSGKRFYITNTTGSVQPYAFSGSFYSMAICRNAGMTTDTANTHEVEVASGYYKTGSVWRPFTN